MTAEELATGRELLAAFVRSSAGDQAAADALTDWLFELPDGERIEALLSAAEERDRLQPRVKELLDELAMKQDQTPCDSCGTRMQWMDDDGSTFCLVCTYELLRLHANKLQEERDRLEKEGHVLRGLVQSNPQWRCPYGVNPHDNIGMCPSGFPGCACADDRLAVLVEDEERIVSKLRAENAWLREALRKLEFSRERWDASAGCWRFTCPVCGAWKRTDGTSEHSRTCGLSSLLSGEES